MKISCNTQILSEACQNVQRAVSNKTTIPALEGILFEAHGDTVKLTGYDLDVGIITSVPARVEKEGDIIINAKLLCEILRKLPEDNVIIETDERLIVEIECGQANFSIIGINAAEFPTLTEIEKTKNIRVSGEVLKNMIRQTIFSVDVTENKPIYKGVCFDVKYKELNLVATDGYRLSLRKENINYDGEDVRFVVPAKTLSEVSKLISDSDKEIDIYPENRHIVFNVQEYTIVSRLLEGEFLDYNKVIKNGGTTKVKINRRIFADSVERTSIINSMEKTRVAIKCVFSEDTVKISCNTTIGRAMDKFYADIDGGRIEIGFSNRFLLDALHNIDDDEVILNMSGSNMPMIINPISGDSYRYLILPVRMKDE